MAALGNRLIDGRGVDADADEDGLRRTAIVAAIVARLGSPKKSAGCHVSKLYMPIFFKKSRYISGSGRKRYKVIFDSYRRPANT